MAGTYQNLLWMEAAFRCLHCLVFRLTVTITSRGRLSLKFHAVQVTYGIFYQQCMPTYRHHHQIYSQEKRLKTL